VNIRGPGLIAACLLFALLVTGCTQDNPTASSDADVAAASEVAKARSELASSTPSSPSEEPSVEISVPPQPATLAKNPLYRIGRLPASRCAEPEHEPTSLASVRAYYSELLTCMNKAWAPAIHKAGFTFRPPKLVVTEGRSASSPCEYTDRLAYYCGDTIYMDATTDIDYYADDPDLALVWMAFNFGHEYGHHVQALAGILQAKYQRGLTLNGVDAALEESRRVELQASCLAGVYLGADRAWFPITSDWLDGYDYVVRNTLDPEHDHGKRANHGQWSIAGLDAADPAACNTYIAGSALVS
jgi:predicted metalloprotease